MFLLIDKPKGITSHDVVDEIRKITGEQKVGHAGTLDPNATGLLILGVGRASTKKLGEISKKTKKTYQAEVFLGEERDTDDVEGEILRQVQDDKVSMESLPALSKANIVKVLSSFIGQQKQTPPAYSAIKVKGKKAYQLARKGKKPRLKARKIVIDSIKLISYRYPKISIETQVSSGTYIRALARDIGRRVGCGAYLKNLRRTKVGKHALKNAVALKSLKKSNWKKFASKNI